MSKGTPKLTLPADAAVGSLRAAVDEGLRFLGLGLRKKFMPEFIAAYGNDWRAELGRLRGTPRVNSADPSFLLKELSYFDSPCHRALGENSPLDGARKCLGVRNGLYHFRTDEYGSKQAVSDLATLLQFARAASLACEPDLEELLGAVDAITLSGPRVAPTAAEMATLKEQLESERELNRQAQQRLEEVEDSIETIEARRAAAEESLDVLTVHQSELRAQLAAAGAMAAGRVELVRELEAVHGTLATQEAAIRTSADEATAARAVLVVERAKRLDAELKLEELKVEATLLTVGRGTDLGVDPAVKLALDELRNSVALPAVAPGFEEPIPMRSQAAVARTVQPAGDPWFGARGDAVWTLSKASRDLYENSSGRLITDLLGDTRGRRVVDEFLLARPSGGRVWMDQRGDCTTTIGGELVYLGNAFADNAGPQDPAPGAQIPGGPVGVRYILRQRDIEELRSGRRLSGRIGPDGAAAVATRLRIGRHEGGRIWVGADGLVTTRKGEAHVFLGRVSAEEWFGPFNLTSLAG